MVFYLGQEVVCIDATPTDHPRSTAPAWIVKDRHYFIEGFTPSGKGLYLKGDPEIGTNTFGIRIGWSGRRFRPLVKRKTDISIFTAMLNPKQREKA